MKKLLIATAALAMVAGTAQAQSSVTVYGKLDAGYSDRKAEGTSGAKASGAGVVFNAHETSRWGLRGTEDLGGGLKANFVIETQLGDDNNKRMDAILKLPNLKGNGYIKIAIDATIISGITKSQENGTS